jgi:hypothetical protein
VFQHFDKDCSGTIDSFELQSALRQFGMKLSPNLLSLLVAKFGTLGWPPKPKELSLTLFFFSQLLRPRGRRWANRRSRLIGSCARAFS